MAMTVIALAGLVIQTISQTAQIIIIRNLLNNMVNGEWLLEQARKYGFYFDQLLIKYANQIYNYFTEILNGTLFTKDVIDHFTSRAYILVGIFIFFKLCILAIKYIAAPEQFLDSKTGGEQLIKRILFGSLIIIVLPMVFDIAMGIQSAIIKDNVIEKLILPNEVYEDIQKNKDNVGRRIGMTILNGFFGWNEVVMHDSDYVNYQMVLQYESPEYIDYKKDMIEKDSNDNYKFSYVPIISTLAIGYFLLTLVRYTMEITYRSIKLLFLQIIAPFSIVKYMLDPADNDSLKKWLNTTISTYILIFVRMLTLWFIAMMTYYLKNGIPSSDGTVSLLQSDTDGVLKALIVLGMFAFLKELPKLISELFGYNLQDNEAIGGILNQATGAIKGWATGVVGMKSMQDSHLYAWQTVSAIGGGVASGAQAFNSHRDNKMKLSDGKDPDRAGSVASFISYGVAPGFNSITNMNAQMVSSNFGNSMLGPLTRQTQFATQMSPSDISFRSEAKKAEIAGEHTAFTGTGGDSNDAFVSTALGEEIEQASKEAGKEMAAGISTGISAGIADGMSKGVAGIPGVDPKNDNSQIVIPNPTNSPDSTTNYINNTADFTTTNTNTDFIKNDVTTNNNTYSSFTPTTGGSTDSNKPNN